MRKHLLFLLMAMLMPVVAFAANMALQKTMPTYVFRGSTDNRLVVSTSVLGGGASMTGAEDYTFCTWIKLTNVDYNATYSTKGGMVASLSDLTNMDYSGNWCLTVMPDGKATMNGANGIAGASSVDFPVNEWVYLSVVIDNTHNKGYLYINGQLGREADLTGPMYYNGTDGFFQLGGYSIGCEIDDVQFFTSALSAEQIGVVLLNPIAASSLQARYTFEETAAGSANLFDNVVDNGNTVQADYRFYDNAGTSLTSKTYRDYTSGGGLQRGVDKAGTATLVVSDREEAPATAMVVVDGDIANGSIIVKKGDEVIENSMEVMVSDELTLEAQPAEGYRLLDFYAVSGDVREKILSPYMVVKPVTLTAEFTNEYHSLTVVNPVNVEYTITRNGEVVTDLTSMIGAGAEYQLTLNVTEDKIFEGVKLGEETLEAVDGVYTFTLADDATLTIDARLKVAYTITIEQPENGTVTVVMGGETLSSGDAIYETSVLTISAVAAPGYHFESVTVNGEELASDTYVVTGDVTISAIFAEGIDYCIPTPVPGRSVSGSITSYAGRGVNNIEVSCGEEQMTVAGAGTKAAREVYLDRTENTLVVIPGEAVSLKVNGAGEWMHTHIFVDFNRDGFTMEDCVFTHGSAGNQQISGTFSFIVPDKTPAGTYRVRYMLDWDGISPCQYGQEGKDNGEAILDFNIQILSTDYDEPRTISVSAANELGSVAITDPATEELSVETAQKKVTVIATPVEGAAFINWTDAEGQFVSDNAEYTYSAPESIALVAHFGYYVTLTIEGEGKVDMQADGVYFTSGAVVAPETEIELTATPGSGKALISVTVNGETVETNAGVATFAVTQATDIQVVFGEKQLTFAYTVFGKGAVYACTELGDGEDDAEDMLIPAGDMLESGSPISTASEVFFFLVPDEDEEIASLIENEGDEENDVTEDVEGDEFALADGTPAFLYSKYGFRGDYSLIITFTDKNAAIDSIAADGEAGEVEFFNLQGVKVGASNLTPGIYVVRHGSTTAKVLVK